MGTVLIIYLIGVVLNVFIFVKMTEYNDTLKVKEALALLFTSLLSFVGTVVIFVAWLDCSGILDKVIWRRK